MPLSVRPLYLVGIALLIAAILLLHREKSGNSGERSHAALPAKDSLTYPHAPGDVLQNRYQVLEGIGRGASGSVYLVRDLQYPDMSVQWVLKEADFGALDLDERQEALELFRRECELLKTLNHPSIPKVIDSFISGTRPAW